MSMNFSGSKSSSVSTSKDDVWGEQAPYLTNMYQQGQSALQSSVGDVNAGTAAARSFAGTAEQDIFDPAKASYQQQFGADSNLAQTASQVTPALGGTLNQMMGDPVQNPYLQANVQRALGDVSTNFNENIMPGLRTDAANMGQFGGSRQGVAEGIAAKGAQKQMADIANQMYSSAYDQGQLNRLSAAQQAGGLLGGASDAAAQGITAGQSLANLGMVPAAAYQQAATMGFAPIQAQAGIVGGPTVLGDSYSRSKSKSYGGGGGMG